MKNNYFTMSTTKPRINITLEEKTVSILTGLAQERQISTASLAKELILVGLSYQEDLALATIAELRDIENAIRVNHQDAWR